MPRPPRRTRAVSSRTSGGEANAAAKEPTTTKAVEPSSENRRRTRRSDIAKESDAKDSGKAAGDAEPKRRTSLRQAASTARHQTASRQARGPDASGLDVLDDDAFGGMDTTFDMHDLDDLEGLEGLDSSPEAAASPSRTRGRENVTHSTDTTSSSFNVGLFRRGRPRQSSIHSRDDAPIRPSSRGPATPSLSSTFSLGTFRRRAREPSILGRRRRDRSQRSRDRDNETSGSELDAGPYTSDAEPSVPASVRRGRSRVSQAHVQDASAASLATGNSTSMVLPPRGRVTRKRKSEEGQRDNESPKRRSTQAAPSEEDDALPSVEAPLSSPLSLPPLSSPPSLPMSDADRRRYTTPGGPDDVDPAILAPPASSGSESADSPIWPSLRGLANGTRRARPAALTTHAAPELEDDDSDIPSPPSLTHSPNAHTTSTRAAAAKSKRKPAAQPKNVAPLTTAALAALLPQRRHRADGRFMDSEEGDDEELHRSALLSEDDDELADRPRRGRSAARAPQPAVLGNRRSAAKDKKPVKRTYGSRSFSDKENEEADESSFSPLPDNAFEDETTEVAPVSRKNRYFGEEVEKASKKFKEVDRWTLEFERVSRSSSPVDAR